MNPHITRMLVDDVRRQIRADVRTIRLPRGPSPPRMRIGLMLARIVHTLHAGHFARSAAPPAARHTTGSAHVG
jgi:hypothetical protein